MINSMLNVYKKAAAPVGTTSKRKDGVYQKMSDGSWKKVTDGKEKPKEDEKREETSDEVKEEFFADISDEGVPWYQKHVDESFKYVDRDSLTALETYASDSDIINRGLRGDFEFSEDTRITSEEDLMDEVEHIDRAFKDAQSIQTNQLYRGAVLSKEILDNLNDGTVFSDKGFVSTTSSVTTAQHFAQLGEELGENENNVIFVIEPKKNNKALPISTMIEGENIDELEFLLNRNTEFKIKEKFYDNSNKVWRLALKIL